MSTHRAGPPGSTYFAASYRAPEPSSVGEDRWGGHGSPAGPGVTHVVTARQRGAHAAPPRPRPGSGLHARPPRPEPDRESGSHAAPPRPRPNPGQGAASRPSPAAYESVAYEVSRYAPSDTLPSGEVDDLESDREYTDSAPARTGRRVPIVIGVLAVVVVLCIGGGAAGYFLLGGEETSRERPAALETPSVLGSAAETPSAPPPVATASATRSPAGGEEEVSGDLSGLRQGDCLTVDESDDNRVEKATCTEPGAQKVLLRKGGTLDDSACRTVNAAYSLSQDASGSARDFVLCVGPAR